MQDLTQKDKFDKFLEFLSIVNAAHIKGLCGYLPSWVKLLDSEHSKITIEAAPLRASGKPTRDYRIEICEVTGSKIEAREVGDPTFLPKFCPQRHINHDSTFCLGLKAGTLGTEAKEYVAWWRKLEVFLTSQEAARSTGIWPPEIQIAHGKAGEIQPQAELLADKLGLREEFDEAMQLGKGRLFESVRLVRPRIHRLRNGRAECPCLLKNKNGRLKLRRKCFQGQQDCLVTTLWEMQHHEKEFWKSHRDKACCGTMNRCPLRPI